MNLMTCFACATWRNRPACHSDQNESRLEAAFRSRVLTIIFTLYTLQYIVLHSLPQHPWVCVIDEMETNFSLSDRPTNLSARPCDNTFANLQSSNPSVRILSIVSRKFGLLVGWSKV